MLRDIHRLANEVMQGMGRQSKVNLRAPVDKAMGINTTSLYGRKALFWRDLARFCDAFWSMTIKWDLQKYGHLFFTATGGAGTTLSILFLFGGKSADAVESTMTVRKGDKERTVRRTYDSSVPIHKMVYELDKISLDLGQKWGG